MRAVLLALSTTILLAGPAFAQSSAELIEKAIYLEDVVGDVNGAVAIYRQLLSTPSAPGRATAIAERRLSAATAKTRGAEATNAPTGATRFRHPGTGIQFDAPPGWAMAPAIERTDGGAETVLTDTRTGQTIGVYMTSSGDSSLDAPLPPELRTQWLVMSATSRDEGWTLLLKPAIGTRSATEPHLLVRAIRHGAALVSFRETVGPNDKGILDTLWPSIVKSAVVPEGRN